MMLDLAFLLVIGGAAAGGACIGAAGGIYIGIRASMVTIRQLLKQDDDTFLAGVSERIRQHTQATEVPFTQGGSHGDRAR